MIKMRKLLPVFFPNNDRTVLYSLNMFWIPNPYLTEEMIGLISILKMQIRIRAVMCHPSGGMVLASI